MTIYDVLRYLMTAGGAAAALSFILERVEWFQGLSATNKSWVVLGGTLVIALGAKAILVYVPKEILDALAPWFEVVAGVVVAWVGTQLAHLADPARIKSARDI